MGILVDVATLIFLFPAIRKSKTTARAAAETPEWLFAQLSKTRT
jgi:hypothetical protein